MRAKRQSKVGKIIRRTIAALLLLSILTGIGMYVVTILKAKYTRTFEGHTATTGSISSTISCTGKLTLVDSITYTAKENATVKTLYVAQGSDVKNGDKLMRLSNGQSITADFDGRINMVYADVGETVNAGTSLITLADFSHMKIIISVDEYQISSIFVGKECTVTMTATGKRYNAAVSSINYVAATSSTLAYYSVEIPVDVQEGTYPGMQATVDFTEVAAANVTVLQKSALSFDESNSAYVWKLNEAGEMEQCHVVIGAHNDNYVQILSGVSDGETIYLEQENTVTAASGIVDLFSSAFQSSTSSGNSNSTTKKNRDSGTGSGSGSGKQKNNQQQ